MLNDMCYLYLSTSEINMLFKDLVRMKIILNGMLNTCFSPS